MPAIEVSKLATVCWTSTAKLNGRELCPYINQAVREDDSPLVDKAVSVCHIMNTMIVTRDSAVQVGWPDNYTTYRGLGMPRGALRVFYGGEGLIWGSDVSSNQL